MICPIPRVNLVGNDNKVSDEAKRKTVKFTFLKMSLIEIQTDAKIEKIENKTNIP